MNLFQHKQHGLYNIKNLHKILNYCITRLLELRHYNYDVCISLLCFEWEPILSWWDRMSNGQHINVAFSQAKLNFWQTLVCNFSQIENLIRNSNRAKRKRV